MHPRAIGRFWWDVLGVHFGCVIGALVNICQYLPGSLGGTLEPMASDSDFGNGDFGNGLAKAESVFLWLGVPFAREGDVLVADSDNVHLRIGYYDEHFLVNIGVHPHSGEVHSGKVHSGEVSWVGFDLLREDELLEFLRNALPYDITSSS